MKWQQLQDKRPLVTRAKKAIAGFKIREGMPIGCTVTLRGDRMYSFFGEIYKSSFTKNKRL